MACAVAGVPPDAGVTIAVMIQVPAALNTTEFPPHPETPFANAAVPGPDADHATVAIVPFVQDTISASEAPTVTGSAGANWQVNAVVSAGGVAPLGAHLCVRVLASQFEEQVPWSLTGVEALNRGAAVTDDAAVTARTNEHPSARAHSVTFIPNSRQHRIAFRLGTAPETICKSCPASSITNARRCRIKGGRSSILKGPIGGRFLELQPIA